MRNLSKQLTNILWKECNTEAGEEVHTYNPGPEFKVSLAYTGSFCVEQTGILIFSVNLVQKCHSNFLKLVSK